VTGGPLLLVLEWIFVAAGSLFLIIGGIGLLRLPDFYSRIHAAGITDTMGAWLLIVGLLFTAGDVLPHLKLVMLLIFLIITSPLASHALAKAAYLRHLKPMVGPELEREGDDD
jgi:multicomponent Na+:H+ antiporter subunit G